MLQPQHHKSVSPLNVLLQKEGPNVSPKEPSDHNISLVFFDFVIALDFTDPQHEGKEPLVCRFLSKEIVPPLSPTEDPRGGKVKDQKVPPTLLRFQKTI